MITFWAASIEVVKAMSSPLASSFFKVTTELSRAESSVFRIGSLKEIVTFELGEIPVAASAGSMATVGAWVSTVLNVISTGWIALSESSSTEPAMAT